MNKLSRLWLLLPVAFFMGCTKNNPASPVTNNYYLPTPTTGVGAVWRQALADNTSISTTQFRQRDGEATAAFNGALWVVGGLCGGGYLNDVWKSTDGTAWIQVLANTSSPPSTQFPQRVFHSLTVYNGALWVMGGLNGSGNMNDVWKSSDGVTWTQVLANTSSPSSGQFSQRNGHTSVVFNGTMWVIGGSDGSGALNDVWKSTDGAAWTRVLADASSPPFNQFPERVGHTSLVFNGAMWVIGGTNGSGNLNDVWNSTDGVHWTESLADASSPPSSQFSRRYAHASVVDNGAMWVIGGNTGSGYLNDVWNSTDGINWTRATLSAAFPVRAWHSAVVYNNEVWVMGGANSGGYQNDVWYSP